MHDQTLVTVSAALIRDPRLSARAKGVFAVLASFREDERISAQAIAAASSEGRGATLTALRELEELGYLTRTQHRRPNGQLSAAEWTITDTPPPHLKAL
ncbi:helix-turn-helix domain-containing protein [Nocardia wallacei]|uniref:helix-turn-helix domain-containing protein n=1 Tax=Nocardia wallacei TaxID=480035 RepID=UPI00245867D5|nr:helix-turn-helix domain-containing protein [Nocardia wallacei]